jgi:hypothetical protein
VYAASVSKYLVKAVVSVSVVGGLMLILTQHESFDGLSDDVKREKVESVGEGRLVESMDKSRLVEPAATEAHDRVIRGDIE